MPESTEYLGELKKNYDLVFVTESRFAFPLLGLKNVGRYFLSISVAPGEVPLFFEFHEKSVTRLNFVHWIYRRSKSLLYRDYPFYRTISRRELRTLLNQPAYYRQVDGVSFFTTCPSAAAGWEPL